MPIRAGSTSMVSAPSCQFMCSIHATMPISTTKSLRVEVVLSRKSCSAFTSPCSRAMIRPTWVLSMNVRATVWKWSNIARRTSKITFCASRVLIDCDSSEVMVKTTTATPNSNTIRSIRPGGVCGVVAAVTAWPIITGSASWANADRTVATRAPIR